MLAAKVELDTLEQRKISHCGTKIYAVQHSLVTTPWNQNLCCPAQPSDYTVYTAPAAQDTDTNFGVVLSSTIYLTSTIKVLC